MSSTEDQASVVALVLRVKELEAQVRILRGYIDDAVNVLDVGLRRTEPVDEKKPRRCDW